MAFQNSLRFHLFCANFDFSQKLRLSLNRDSLATIGGISPKWLPL